MQVNDTATGLKAGNYLVVVTDANGCHDSTHQIFTQPKNIFVSNSFTQNVSCFGFSDGASAIKIDSGGVAPFSFAWNTIPVIANDSALGLAANSYTVTITDSIGCSVQSIITITQPNLLSVSTSIIQNETCFGMHDGIGKIDSITGGTLPYSLMWNIANQQTNDTVTNLPGGQYMVVITDGHNCSATDTINIVAAPLLTAQLAINTNVLCHGDSSGAVKVVNISGGTGVYSYMWNTNPVQTNSTASSLPAGTYSCIIHDQNNCVYIDSITLTEPPPITNLIASTLSNVNCYGDSTGIITATLPNGGSPPFSFHWNTIPSQTTQSVSNATAGIYTVTVTDNHGCQSSDTTIVTQSAPLTNFAITSTTNASCIGVDNGTATVNTPSGGMPPYTYSWSSVPMQFMQTGINLPAGLYTITATDQLGCKIDAHVQIGINGGILANLFAINPTCSGFTNGQLVSIITGGTKPFTYNWNNNSYSTPNLQNLAEGFYLLRVTDSAGCSDTASARLVDPLPLKIETYSTKYSNGFEISAFGASDGNIICSVSGGSYPYRYNWNNGEKVPNIHGLPAGEYHVVVTDSQGCVITDDITLRQIEILAMPTGFTPNGDGDNDYYVIKGIEAYPSNTFSVFNRWGNKVYEQENYNNRWNGQSHLRIDLPIGTYYVVLKDSNDTTIKDSYVDLRR